MADGPENFADHPVSITEARGNKEHSCALWQPRDALIDLLRRIDKGECEVDALVLAYRERDSEGVATRFSLAAPDLATGLGLCCRVQYLMNGSN